MLGGLNKNFFFIVLETGKSTIKVLAGEVPSENLFLALGPQTAGCFLTASSQGE